MDNQIGVGVYDSLLGRLLNMPQQQGGIVPALSPEVSATLVLESDRPEWCFLKGERCCAGMADVPATVGQVGRFRLRNPVGSGALVVVEAFTVYSPVITVTQVELLIGTATTDYGTVSANNVQRDSRTGQQKGVVILSSDVTGAASVGTPFELGATSIGFLNFQNFPLVLGPGSSMDVTTSPNNQEMIFVARWRERELRQYEQGK